MGITWTMPTSAFSFGVDSGTLATPGRSRSSSAMPSITPSGSSQPTMVALMINGPL